MIESHIRAACLDEWEKIAKPRRVRTPSKKERSLLGGVLGGAALGAAGWLALRKGVRADIMATLRGIGRKGGARAAENTRALPAEVVRQANTIADDLIRAGVDPKKSVIAVSGMGGSGKSTLAKALAQRLNVKAVDYDMVAPSKLLKAQLKELYRALRHLGPASSGPKPGIAKLPDPQKRG